MIILYHYMEQPPYWIAHDEDGYWLVPVRDGGWNERTPFIGHVINLRKVNVPHGVALGLPASS